MSIAWQKRENGALRGSLIADATSRFHVVRVARHTLRHHLLRIVKTCNRGVFIQGVHNRTLYAEVRRRIQFARAWACGHIQLQQSVGQDLSVRFRSVTLRVR